jgi:hypothetical protein
MIDSQNIAADTPLDLTSWQVGSLQEAISIVKFFHEKGAMDFNNNTLRGLDLNIMVLDDRKREPEGHGVSDFGIMTKSSREVFAIWLVQ